MNVFVLGTGRCGTMTFAKACGHMTNFTASHESGRNRLGPFRFQYPANHIAVDYRLGWMLGRLDAYWGTRAFYVHLVRDPKATADSLVRLARLHRRSAKLVEAFDLPDWLNYASAPVWAHMHVQAQKMLELERSALDMVESKTADIAMFLKDKQHMVVHVERAQEDFGEFWDVINAEGDKLAALAEWATKHNSWQDRLDEAKRTFTAEAVA